MEFDLPFFLSVAAVAASAYATFAARQRIAAEAAATEAESVETYNRVILSQLDYLDRQMTEMRQHTEALQKEVAEYREQIKTAMKNEASLRMQVGQLRVAVRRLREYILAQGLTPPIDDDGEEKGEPK